MNRADKEDFAIFATICVLVCLLAPMAKCQSLPDAPVPNTQHECWRGVYYDDGRFGTVPVDCDKVPPAWRAFNMRAPLPAPGYWAFRRASEPYLRTNRQTLHSKMFWFPAAAAVLSTTGDVLVQRHNRQIQSPPLPAGSELYIDAYVPLAAGLGFDYVADRFIGRPIGTLIMGYITGKHIYGAVSGRYP